MPLLTPHRLAPRRLLFLALAVASLLPSVAAADARIAILPFRGPSADDARAQTHEALRDQPGVRVAPLARTDRAVDGATGARAGELAVRRLDVDYLVSGRVQRRGRRARVSLVLRDADGRVVARASVTIRGRRGRFGPAARTLARAAEEPFEAEAEDRDEAPREEPRRAPRSRRARRPSRSRDGRDAPVLDAHVGARLEGRLARFVTTTGDVHRNDVAYPVLTAAMSARPWIGEEGIERGIELRGLFGYAVGLRSRNTLTDEAVDTSFFHVYADVGLLFEVERGVELGLGAGFGWDSFSFGEQSLVVVPSAEYAYLRPHLRGRFQIEEELAVLGIEVGYRGVLARGALSEHFGQEGQTQGFDVVGRLGGSLDMGLSYGLEAGLAGYFHFFDGDAITAPATEGTDFALWLGAQVGFAFR